MSRATSSNYFDFVLLLDDSYGIKAKDVGNMPEKVILPIKHQGKLVTEILNHAFSGCDDLVEIAIPNSIKIIREEAFSYCTCLENIEMGSGLVCIEKLAFADCGELGNINIGENVKIIGEHVFYNSRVKKVYIPANTEEIGRCAFAECYELVEIMVNEANTKYKSVDGNLYSNDKGEFIQYAIGKPQTTFIIPDSVNKICEFAFACSDLENIAIPNSVEKIEYGAFDECDSLKIFCQAISKPDSWDKDWNCSNCPVVWGNIDVEKEIFFDNILYEIKDDVAIIKKIIADTKDVNLCPTINYENRKYNVVEIGKDAFRRNSKIFSITIPKNIIKIGVSAFCYCDNLTSVFISSSVTEIGIGAFAYCTNLEKIIVSKENKHYKDIDGTLYNAKGNVLIQQMSTKESLIITNNVTEIGSYAFAGCKITNIQIPESVTSINDSAFSGCEKLESITVNENNKNYKDIEGNLYSKDGSVFIKYIPNKTLSSFVIPNGVTILDRSAFLVCSNLTTIKLPDSLTTIGIGVFAGCISLRKIVIPNSVISIGDYAFLNCAALTSITISDSVTSIGDYAFYECSSLTSVYYKGTQSEWEQISIGSENSKLTDATRYYYSESRPSEDGNFWHYGENGEIVIW